MTDKSGKLVSKDDKFVYIPILSTLQQLMNNDSIRNEVMNILLTLYVVHVTDSSIINMSYTDIEISCFF